MDGYVYKYSPITSFEKRGNMCSLQFRSFCLHIFHFLCKTSVPYMYADFCVVEKRLVKQALDRCDYSLHVIRCTSLVIIQGCVAVAYGDGD